MVNIDPLSPEIMFFVVIYKATDDLSRQQFKPWSCICLKMNFWERKMNKMLVEDKQNLWISASIFVTDGSRNKTEVLRSAPEWNHTCFHKHIYVVVIVPINRVDIAICQLEKWVLHHKTSKVGGIINHKISFDIIYLSLLSYIAAYSPSGLKIIYCVLLLWRPVKAGRGLWEVSWAGATIRVVN